MDQTVSESFISRTIVMYEMVFGIHMKSVQKMTKHINIISNHIQICIYIVPRDSIIRPSI